MSVKKDSFPFYIFLTYVIYYAGQAIYNTFGTVYLSESGFSQSVIGLMASVATAALILIQPLWGILSDRSKNKNHVAGIVILISAVIILAVYLNNSLWWIAACYIGFSIFYGPAATLQDNCTLEALEGSRWNFGNVRLGGTLGYMFCALIVGFFIKDYNQTYLWTALFFIPAGLMLFFTRATNSTHGQKAEKVRYRSILSNKPLLCIVLYNVLYTVAGTFSRYYTIHYTENLGATSLMLSLCTVIASLVEIPFFWYAGRIERKLGIMNTFLLSGALLVIRYILFSFITDPIWVIAVYTINSCGWALSNFSVLSYINNHVPAGARATSQSLNSILATVFSSIIFAPIAGFFCDTLGTPVTLLIGAALMAVTMVVFRIVFPRLEKAQASE